MRKNLHKLLFVGLLLGGFAMYSQTALPGTLEAESGTLSGIVGTSCSGTCINNLRGGSGNSVTHSVSVATAGDYDFTFTYNRSGSSAGSVTMEIVGGATLFTGLSMVQTSGMETIKKEKVALTAGTYDIKFYNTNGSGFSLDKYVVTASPVVPTITSAGSGNWNAGGTWDGGVVPTSTDNVVIADGHTVTVNTGVTAEMINLQVGAAVSNAGGQFIQKAGSKVNITGNITTQRSQDGYVFDAAPTTGSTTLETGTLIYGGVTITKADGSSKPRVRVTKRVADANQWHLFSYGFDQSRLFEIFKDAHYRVSTTSGNEGNLAFATYDDSQASGLKYTYPYTNMTTFTNNDQAANTTVDGKGYAINTAAGETDLSWRGRLQVADVSINISDGGNGFNLVGNPYPAYLLAGDNEAGADNILKVNGSAAGASSVLQEDTIWFWDADSNAGAGSWVTKNKGDVFNINPMQGFFVKAKSGGGSFQFKEDMQTHTNTQGFYKTSNNRFEISLIASIGKNSAKTSIRYVNNMTTDFDNGYDSSIFGGYASSLEVYTNLVGKDSGKKLAIQSLPNANFEDMIIPVGVTADANSEITFSAKALNVPTGYKVFLEDRLNGAFTRLDVVDAEYTATVTEKSTEGRFYLHARSSALSLDSELLNSVRIFKSNTSTLKIVGLSQGKTNVSLYNVIGEQVLRTSFIANGTKEVSLPRLSKGVYMVQLETETGKVNKKIVLE